MKHFVLTGQVTWHGTYTHTSKLLQYLYVFREGKHKIHPSESDESEVLVYFTVFTTNLYITGFILQLFSTIIHKCFHTQYYPLSS